MTKKRTAKKREGEIARFYTEIGLGTEERRKYMSNLAYINEEQSQPKPVVFIEAGTTSQTHGEFGSAGLESDT